MGAFVSPYTVGNAEGTAVGEFVSPSTVGLADGAAVGLFVSPLLVGATVTTNLVGAIVVGLAVGTTSPRVGISEGVADGAKEYVGMLVSLVFVGRVEGIDVGTALGEQEAGASTAFSELVKLQLSVWYS